MSDNVLPPAAAAPEVSLRRARPSDIEALERIEAIAFACDRLSRRSFRAFSLSANACLLVAARGEVPVGYTLVLLRRGSRVARLYSIAVAPPMSGRGLGERLLAAAEAAARERRADILRLEVRSDNLRAIRLYERRGYVRLGRREAYYEDGMDAVRFERDLRAAAAAPPPLGRAA